MKRLLILTEIFLFFVLPIVWFVAGLSLEKHRLVVFEIFIGLIFILIISRRMSFREMGFRLDNFFSSMKLLLPGMIIGLCGLLVLYKLNLAPGAYFQGWFRNSFFFYYAVLGVVSQEFAYRGFLLARLKAAFQNPLVIIICNAALFALLHALHQSWSVAIGAFVLSAYLTWAYLKQPNLIAAYLAHALVGGTAIILGFV